MAGSSFFYRHRKVLWWSAGALGIALAAVLIVVGSWVLVLDRTVVHQFEGRRWTLPARVYASPMELYKGLEITLPDLEHELQRLQYRKVDRNDHMATGSYRVGTGGIHVEVGLREARFLDEKDPRPPQQLTITLNTTGVENLQVEGKDVPILRLEPLLIGSIFPIHGEDRVVLSPEDVNHTLLPKALTAVEDRNFYSHHGVDPKAILRAIWVNLRHGAVEQGGSTLTQQLVRSYFLTQQRTVSRKVRELVMSVSLDTHFSKDDIMNAYINEIFLGQDGDRAIHGFGLASQFYFGKPLQELDLAEMATLVAVVRGPTYYDPRRRAQKCLERRNRVLKEMVAQGVIKPEDAAAAIKKHPGLDVTARPSGAYFPAYLDFVRRTLKRDYPPEQLTEEGLRIYTALDPRAQESAENALEKELTRLDRLKRNKQQQAATLEGAVVVTSPQSGEVIAIVGSRNVGYDGFNRALDAKRPMGSMVKPFIYLTALESKTDSHPEGYTAATVVQDEPIVLKLPNGTEWKPTNFEKNEVFGPVPIVRALAESMNLATVGVGLDIGLPAVSKTLARFGLERPAEEVPAMLLGAVNVSPLEAAQLYNGLANGGFHSNLRAVTAVVGNDGTALKSYPLEMAPVATPEVVYEVDRMMEQVMNKGTGKPARSMLPPDLVVAGKTGTSSDFRDSWFAGFSGSALVVVWVGYDNDQPTGFTGAAGALPVWAHVMAGMKPASWDAPLPESLAQTWIDYHSGERVDQSCDTTDAVPIAVPTGTQLPVKAGCSGAGAAGSVVQRVGDWLHNLVH